MKVHRKSRYFFAHLSRGLFLIFVSTIEDVSQFNQDNQLYDIIHRPLMFFMNLILNSDSFVIVFLIFGFKMGFVVLYLASKIKSKVENLFLFLSIFHSEISISGQNLILVGSLLTGRQISSCYFFLLKGSRNHFEYSQKATLFLGIYSSK